MSLWNGHKPGDNVFPLFGWKQGTMNNMQHHTLCMPVLYFTEISCKKLGNTLLSLRFPLQTVMAEVDFKNLFPPVNAVAILYQMHEIKL